MWWNDREIGLYPDPFPLPSNCAEQLTMTRSFPGKLWLAVLLIYICFQGFSIIVFNRCSCLGLGHGCLWGPYFCALLLFSSTMHSVILMRTMSLSALHCKRMHYYHKSIFSQFPPGLLHPVNSLRSCSPVLDACDSVIILVSEGRSGRLSCSVLSSNGCLFNTVLSSPTHSNHHLKNHLHYIPSVLHCRTNQCTSDSLRLCECAGILGNQSHPGASEGISGFPQGETAGDTGPCSHDSAAPLQFPISNREQQALNLPCLSAEWRAQYKVTFHFVLTDGKP